MHHIHSDICCSHLHTELAARTSSIPLYDWSALYNLCSASCGPVHPCCVCNCAYLATESLIQLYPGGELPAASAAVIYFIRVSVIRHLPEPGQRKLLAALARATSHAIAPPVIVTALEGCGVLLEILGELQCVSGWVQYWWSGIIGPALLTVTWHNWVVLLRLFSHHYH